MAASQSKHARKFFRVAMLRLEDAEILLRNVRYGAAVYMAGYAVECMLKALVLASSPADQQETIATSFRGSRGHDIDSLREQYRRCGVGPTPKNVSNAFSVVYSWNIELRYEPRSPAPKESERFVNATRVICDWAKGRF